MAGLTMVEAQLDEPSKATAGRARVELLERLKGAGYQFVAPSVATHRRVLRRDGQTTARDLRDVFGWSLPFSRTLLEPGLVDCMAAAGALRLRDGLLVSTLRAASLGQDIFLHSAFPANAPDAVFFGPDSYRFANFLVHELGDAPRGGVLLDIGCGSGVGGVVAARCMSPSQIILADLNPTALDLARANAAAADVAAWFVRGDGVANISEPLDVVVANPPFIAGDGGRTYRDGGDLHGAQVSLDWTLAATGKLAPSGLMLLYTGSAIVAGEDLFRAALFAALPAERFRIDYHELDPDIFGGQLSAPAYRDVERIAAVGVRIERIG